MQKEIKIWEPGKPLEQSESQAIVEEGSSMPAEEPMRMQAGSTKKSNPATGNLGLGGAWPCASTTQSVFNWGTRHSPPCFSPEWWRLLLGDSVPISKNVWKQLKTNAVLNKLALCHVVKHFEITT